MPCTREYSGTRSVRRDRGPQLRERAEQGRKRDPQLEPAELGTEAAVQPVAEGEVRDGSTVRVDTVGIRAERGVTVGARQEQSTMSPTRSLCRPPTSARWRSAGTRPGRPSGAGAVRRRTGRPRSPRSAGRRPATVLQKRERAQGEHGRGGPWPPVSSPSASSASSRSDRSCPWREIRFASRPGRGCAVPGDQSPEIVQRGVDRGERVRHRTERVEALDAALLQLVPVLLRDTEQLTDHLGRHGDREVGHEIGRLSPATSASIRASTTASIRGTRACRRWPVNSGASIRRSRVWSGESVKPSPPGFCAARPSSRSRRGAAGRC